MPTFSVVRTGDKKIDRNLDAIAAVLNPALATLSALSVGCFAYATTATAQTVTNTATPISMGTAVYDTDGAMQSTKEGVVGFVCPSSKPGKYHVCAKLSVGSCTTEAFILLHVNGVEIVRGDRMAGTAGGENCGVSIACDLNLNGGDQVTVNGFSGNSTTLEASAKVNWMTVHKIPSST